ncbi:MAG: kinase [Clostridiaceae bacterium]|nr:kinase [Clostridiaceae bacterium]
MSSLIILRGNSGSGKSSVAKALQRKLGRNTLMIPQDIVRREMLWVRDGKDTAALPLLIELLNYGNTHCEYVILEGIFNAAWYKPLFESAIEFYENRIFAYYYDIPFEETLKRHETKDKRFEFGEVEMRSWWKEKDLIGIIPETIFKEDISLEGAVDIILHDVLK